MPNSKDQIPESYVRLHTHGFVGLVDHMGDDAAVVEAARVSYQTGTKATRSDRNLIRYLMRHRHTTPFEMCEVKLHVRAPIFVIRQWARHRTSSTNEESARYSEINDLFFMPELDTLAAQSLNNKQGRQLNAFDPESGRRIQQGIEYSNRISYGEYQGMLGQDLARELARIVLPLNTYSSFYWKCNLHNMLHFLNLRTDPHAQQEIRDYANAILGIIEPLFPLTVEAWLDYVRNAITLSAMEVNLLRELLRRVNGGLKLAHAIEDMRGESNLADAFGMSGRELAEFRERFNLTF